MIRAVVFDCFGVLSTDGWLAFKQRYLVPGSVEEQDAVELNRQADAGFITQAEFEHELTRLAEVDLGIVRGLIDSHVSNDELFVYIMTRLKPYYGVGLLSNASADFTPELFTPIQNELFDAKVFSYQLGVIKPHPAMYQTIATKLGVQVNECVFIDDREGFVTGAREIGMQAIHYIDNEQLRRDLDAMLLG